MTISEMTDAELDRMIAEKRGESLEHLPEQYVEWVTEDGEDGGSGFYCPRCGQSATSPFCVRKYSTDPRYAMELLKEMKAHLDCVLQPSEIYQWICSPKHTKILVFADTPERAIAEAYLEWAK